jgi:hypothetical protein
VPDPGGAETVEDFQPIRVHVAPVESIRRLGDREKVAVVAPPLPTPSTATPFPGMAGFIARPSKEGRHA